MSWIRFCEFFLTVRSWELPNGRQKSLIFSVFTGAVAISKIHYFIVLSDVYGYNQDVSPIFLETLVIIKPRVKNVGAEIKAGKLIIVSNTQNLSKRFWQATRDNPFSTYPTFSVKLTYPTPRYLHADMQLGIKYTEKKISLGVIFCVKRNRRLFVLYF